jgi:hypothetical protein
MGRVAFFARIDAIRAELAQGWPLTAIYERHKSALGISYCGFWRLVVRHAADARPGRAPSKSSARTRTPLIAEGNPGSGSVAMPVRLQPTAPSDEGPSHHAGQQPARTFSHDPIERPGDYERLFGTRKK